MFGMGKSSRDKGPKILVQLSESELNNILEQERLLTDAKKISMMLNASLNGTMKALADKHKLPKEFDLNRSTGEIREKEIQDG